MKVYEVRSVMNNKAREIKVSPDLSLCFETYMKKLNEVRKGDITALEIFYAGYVIANPIVRENLLKERKQEIKSEKREIKFSK